MRREILVKSRPPNERDSARVARHELLPLYLLDHGARGVSWPETACQRPSRRTYMSSIENGKRMVFQLASHEGSSGRWRWRHRRTSGLRSDPAPPTLRCPGCGCAPRYTPSDSATDRPPLENGSLRPRIIQVLPRPAARLAVAHWSSSARISARTASKSVSRFGARVHPSVIKRAAMSIH